ncbi:hypothetical protein [Pseudomonas fontis]|uniref:DUF4175 domain-containing protein n=1 Tax=Pseudomonas fontis TaxID=2942633 RepID=A0ABT5NSA4_9PSED|nr:hypothetical protein [Pseudomonas fontis]MDD0977116.1 hypothetical protein [Pseudomonas fontis]MDD0991046.1 hypothetical protein [Pseudomonas fontis]
MKRTSSLWKVFGVPCVIGVLGAVGLFAALLGDGWWDSLAWLGLALPVWFSLRGFWPTSR